jgi:peptidoglycan-associated lipoprotein
MEAKRGEFISGFISRGLFLFVGLLFFAGCSTSAKRQDEIVSKRDEEAARAQPGATPSPRVPTSSLETHQKGNLDGGTVRGPLKDVHFDFDHYYLRPDARATLRTDADWLKANPSIRVEIEGHADEQGTNEYNLALGAKRADSVKRYLVDLGIAPGRFSTISYGEELPLCKEHNESCWEKNRRAHFATKTAPTS